MFQLQDNNLTDLPEQIGYLRRLTKLFLNRNKLKKLPEELFKLADLRQLAVSSNCLENISKNISDLIMIEKLVSTYISLHQRLLEFIMSRIT